MAVGCYTATRGRSAAYARPVGDELLFKTMSRGQVPRDGYAGVVWRLPTRGAPGPWMPEVSALEAFRSGYHLHTARHLVDHHLAGNPRVWLAEARGASLAPRGSVVVRASARLVRELDWSFPTRLRLALDTARETLALVGEVEPCLVEALAEAERAAVAPTEGDFRAIEARLLRPTFPKGVPRWEEDDDPVDARARRAACCRYLTVSWALAAGPAAALPYALGAIGDTARAAPVRASYEARVMAALLGEAPARPGPELTPS